MADRSIKLAVIGLGMASTPHMAALKQLAPGIEVGGVYARNVAHRAAISAKWGWRAYESIEAICSDPNIDGAIVLTPPNARMEIVEALAKAGKHVLMEKPLERNLTNARKIVEICEQSNVSLGIVFQHRFRAGAMALTELVRSGKLGRIHLVRVVVPWWREQSYYDQLGRGSYEVDGGGVLITQAIHVMDLMLSLTGSVKEVMALSGTSMSHDMEAEDFANAGLIFTSGALGSITATTASFPGGAETIELTTDNAALRLKAGELIIEWRDGQTEKVGDLSEPGGGSNSMDFPCDWHRDLIADFADSIRDRRQPRICGREALEVHKLIDAMERSSRNGKRIVLAEVLPDQTRLS